MKSFKKQSKFVLIIAAIFTFSACELVEEPNFDDTRDWRQSG